jgi:hypothetical protein
VQPERRFSNRNAMRNGQNKRMRGRPRKSQNPLTRVYESNGPDVKIRGTASHVAEKYVQLARDAQSSGDPVAAENYYQHAEHYFRLIAAVNEQFRQNQPFREGEQRDGGYDDDEDGALEQGHGGEPYAPQMEQAYQPREQSQREQSQPYGGREQRFPPRDRNQQPYRDSRDNESRDNQRDSRDRNSEPRERDQRDNRGRDTRDRDSRDRDYRPNDNRDRDNRDR